MISMAQRFERACAAGPDRPALHVGGESCTYAELHARVCAVQHAIEQRSDPSEVLVGIVAGDTIDTYASVLAVLRAGRAFVPLNPEHPPERNASIVQQAGLQTLVVPVGITELDGSIASGLRILRTEDLREQGFDSGVSRTREDDLAYLLFTSGSTGEPKGVPITSGNLAAFLDALEDAGCAFDAADRVLQMFDLTFDFSIASYLAPLAAGACVVTVPASGIKFGEVYRLLEEEQLTVAPMVPSVLTHLRPYFGDIHLPALRLAFFCGEALTADTVNGWMRCAPNARIVNFYGPTEATVFAMYYPWSPGEGRGKTLNGIVSIGRPMSRLAALVVDDELRPVPTGEKGEICLAGPQLTPGYWNDPARNARSFFDIAIEGSTNRYYRTGDVAASDPEGDFLFYGRVDQQVKLQGYRVELGEIEHHAREVLDGRACVVVPLQVRTGLTELRLVTEGYDGDLKLVLAALRTRVPGYMVPPHAVSIDALPLNPNGKVDRRALERMLSATHE